MEDIRTRGSLLHGLEKSGEGKFLVMELVEGETLAEHIKRGPIPVDESLQIAKQICEALESAHEKGIIHRDLKPANVKITPDGKVKVLDFGLAKTYEGVELFGIPERKYVLYASRTLQLSHKNMSIVARIITAIKITVQTIAQVFSSHKRLMYGYLSIPRCPVRLF
jgi:serine/threonine protein kinase